MRADNLGYLFVPAITLWGVNSVDPQGTASLNAAIPAGFLDANGEIHDPSIPNPSPEFPAPVDGTPNISGKFALGSLSSIIDHTY